MDDPAAPMTRQTLEPLLALLRIVGPKEAPALVTQLHADLTACDELVEVAAPACDWATLRRASHNLTGLAGTCGATTLQAMATDLNRAAHLQDLPSLARISSPLRKELARLIAHVSALSPPAGHR